MLALLLGAVHALSFAPTSFLPLTAWWLQLASFAGLLLLIFGRRVNRDGQTGPANNATRAGWLTWLFGVATFSAGLSWMYISMHFYGGMPSLMAAAAVVLLAAYLAAFGALAMVLAIRTLPDTERRGVTPILIAPFALAGWWTLAELARGLLFTGFPWLSAGYAHVDGPLVGLAPLTGVYGVSFVAVFCAALIAGAMRGGLVSLQRGAIGALLLALAVFAIAMASHRTVWTSASGAPLSVRIVQGNVPQQLKFNPQRARQAMHEYIALVVAGNARLNLLPETAWTTSLSRTPTRTYEQLLAHLRSTQAVFAVGVPMASTEQQKRGRPRVGITNSVATIDGQGQLINRYDKRHLVPFGEFIPPGFRWFVDMMQIPLGEFGRGAPVQPLLQVDGQAIGFNICYEDLFGEELIPQVRNGATLLANVSNMGWFGDSHALPQHLNLSRFRSIELARPMLRSTNTGASVAIDHRGRVTNRLANFEQAALDVSVQGVRGLTPYVRTGLWLPFALALLALLGARILRWSVAVARHGQADVA